MSDAAHDFAAKRDAELGYRYAGVRELRMRDWLVRRDDAEFRKLCAKLSCQRYRDRLRAEGGIPLIIMRLVRARGTREWKAKHGDRVKELNKASRRRVLVRRCAANVKTCPGCGAQWCKIPGVGGRFSKFCSDQCHRRWRYASDPEYRARTLANNAKHKAIARGKDAKHVR